MSQVKGVPRRPVLLVIMDGVGVNPSKRNNALAEAHTPRLDALFSRQPHTVLQASGLAVGLPDGQMGNSEVGHLTMGCGEIVRQDLVHIDDCIADGSFYENPALRAAVEHAGRNGRPLHLLGLVSDGGVHSHIRHLKAMIELCRRHRVRPLLHMFTDGRDTAPRCARPYLDDVLETLRGTGGAIATVMGRYYAMDRDNRWDRIELAWQAIVNNRGWQAFSAYEALEAAYARGLDDEFIVPTVLPEAQPITAEDALVFINFRKDRARQLTSALFRPDFDKFPRGDFAPVGVTCMTEYDEWYRLPYAFAQDRPCCTVAEVVSRAGLQQFHCAETEKYPHVTYFFNGGKGDAHSGETRQIIPSPQVATYDLKPEMSAQEVADAVIAAIARQEYAFVVVNFANGDMVGHTGKREAIVQAVEALDRQVGRVVDAATEAGYSVILTADHGNCEEMVDPMSGVAQTQHTVYPVPCLIVDEVPWQLTIGAGLSSIAPTILHLMGMRIPETMTGRSLLLKPLGG